MRLRLCHWPVICVFVIISLWAGFHFASAPQEAVSPILSPPDTSGPHLQTSYFKVTGLSCELCPKHLRAMLRREKGVVQTVVDIKTQVTAVTYDTTLIMYPRIIEAIEAAGYGAQFYELPDSVEEKGR